MADDSAAKDRAGFFTPRKVNTLIIIAIATVMVFTRHMSDGVWVEAIGVALVGHNAADVVKAFKGGV